MLEETGGASATSKKVSCVLSTSYSKKAVARPPDQDDSQFAVGRVLVSICNRILINTFCLNGNGTGSEIEDTSAFPPIIKHVLGRRRMIFEKVDESTF